MPIPMFSIKPSSDVLPHGGGGARKICSADAGIVSFLPSSGEGMLWIFSSSSLFRLHI